MGLAGGEVADHGFVRVVGGKRKRPESSDCTRGGERAKREGPEEIRPLGPRQLWHRRDPLCGPTPWWKVTPPPRAPLTPCSIRP